MDYEKRIKKLLIKDFIELNGYAPSKEKINELYFLKEKQYRGIEKYGFSGIETKKVNFQETSSVTKENQNRRFIKEDIEYQRWKANEIRVSTKTLLEAYIANLHKALKKLDSEELRVNNLLAMQGEYDFFGYSFTESFENHEKINFLENKNSLIENGYATIQGVNRKALDLKNKNVQVSFSSDGSIVTENIISKAKNITNHNGNGFSAVVEGSGPSNKISCFLTLDLKEENYVGSVKLFCNPLSRNGITRYKVHYSVDGNNFIPVNSFYKSLDNGENYTSIGVDRISKIKIELMKNRSDAYGEDKNLYYFNLDTVELNQSTLEKNTRAEFVLGPYLVKDKENNPINFSMATLSDSTCCIIPETTSVSFFVSKDKVNWKFIEQDENKNNYVRFGNLNYIPSLKNESQKDLYSFCEERYDFINNEEESILNFKLPKSEFEYFNKDLIVIERNILNRSERTSGWEKTGNRYKCNFYIEQIEGVVFDFGQTECMIDERVRTGRVHISQGYHTFETSFQNWNRIDLTVNSVEDFRRKDPLYPFNHKYIIEGYNYGISFSGEKIYFGANRVFEDKLVFLPQAKFDENGDKSNFTIVQNDSELYLKVKISSTNMSWKNHKNNVIIYKSENGSNELYIKAIMETKKENVAPHINSISVKVI